MGDGSMKDAGRIGFRLCGTYDSSVAYESLDVVLYEDASYAAKKDTVGNTPEEDNEFWQLFAKGKNVIGAVTGVKGNDEINYRAGDVNITKDNIGLGNVEDMSPEEIRNGINAANLENALGYNISDAIESIREDMNEKADKAVSIPFILLSESWTGDVAPYLISFTLNGLIDQDVEIIPQSSVTPEQIQGFINAQIITGETSYGVVTLKSYANEKPDMNLPIVAIIR